jgi:hypothetical protein
MFLIFTIIMIIVMFIFIKSSISSTVELTSSAISSAFSSSGTTDRFVTHFDDYAGQYKNTEAVDHILSLWKSQNKVISYSKERLSNGDYVYTVTTTKDFMRIFRQAACGNYCPFRTPFDADKYLK